MIATEIDTLGVPPAEREQLAAHDRTVVQRRG